MTEDPFKLLKQGDMVAFLDSRSFGRDELQQAEWEASLLAQLPPGWKVIWTTLVVGDTLLVVITEAGPHIIMIAEEKWNIADLRASVTDGRFYGPQNEIERLSEVGAKDDQYVLATVDDPDSYGTLHSLWRDYKPMLFTITTMENYAKYVAKFAFRWNHEPTEKGQLKKKNLPLSMRKKNFLSYLFVPSLADQLLVVFPTVADAIAPIKDLEFNKKGMPKVPVPAYRGVSGMGETRLKLAHDILFSPNGVKKDE